MASGIYIGMVIDKKWFGMDRFPFYSDTSLIHSILRIAVVGIISSPILITKLFPRDGYSYITTFVIRKLAVPVVGLTYLFGMGRWISANLGLINTRQPREEEDIVYYLKNTAKKNY